MKSKARLRPGGRPSGSQRVKRRVAIFSVHLNVDFEATLAYLAGSYPTPQAEPRQKAPTRALISDEASPYRKAIAAL